MEANTVTLNNNTVEKKMRKPSLPAKFNKFIQFGYFFLKQYNAMDGVTPIDETEFLDKLHLFDTVDNQQAFVQSFFDDAKNINKTIRKTIQAKIKADKKAAAPPKVKAPRAKKTKPTTDASSEPTIDGSSEPTTKTSRRKTKIAVVPDIQDDLINELTSLANNINLNDTPTTTTTTTTTTKTEKKTKTDKPKAEKKPKTDKPKAEKKTKTDKNTKTDNNIDNHNDIDNDNDNDNDVITSPIIIDGKQFLIDDLNNIYDFDNHLIVGKLINNSFTSI